MWNERVVAKYLCGFDFVQDGQAGCGSRGRERAGSDPYSVFGDVFRIAKWGN